MFARNYLRKYNEVEAMADEIHLLRDSETPSFQLNGNLAIVIDKALGGQLL